MNVKPVFEKTRQYKGDNDSYNQAVWDAASDPDNAALFMRYNVQTEKLDDRHIRQAIEWNKKNSPRA